MPLLQPLDLGVIACVKNQYKNMVAERAVNLLDAGYIDDPYKIDIRMAGMWIYDIWSRLQHDIIQNCWAKSELV